MSFGSGPFEAEVKAEIEMAVHLANKMFAEGFKQGLLEGKRQAFSEMKEMVDNIKTDEQRAADWESV